MKKKLWFIKSKHQRDSFKGISQTEDSRCHRTQWKQSADEVSLKLECEVTLKPAENWYVWRSQDFAQLGTVAYTRLAVHHHPPSDPNPNWTSICEEIWCFTTDLDRFCWEKWANNEAPCWNTLTQTVCLLSRPSPRGPHTSQDFCPTRNDNLSPGSLMEAFFWLAGGKTRLGRGPSMTGHGQFAHIYVTRLL